MRLFLYGTLLDSAMLARRAGWSALGVRPRPAVLRGWRRVAARGGTFPTLRRAPGAETRGALLDAPAAVLPRLDAWEGPAYRLRRVVVQCGRGETAAWAWIAPATDRPWPAPRRS